MSEIFALNIRLIRKRFKIYGIFNIISLIAAITLILFGIKFVQGIIGNYARYSVFEFIVIFVLFSETVFPKHYVERCERIKTFFRNIEHRKIESYYSRINFIIFEICFIFFLCPTDLKDIKFFICHIFINNILLFLMIWLKKHSNSLYASISGSLRIILCVISFAYLQNIFPVPRVESISEQLLIVLFIVSIMIFYKNYDNIGYNLQTSMEEIYFYKITRKCNLLSNNYDVLRMFRKNKFINAIIGISITNIAFKSIAERPQDTMWVYLFSVSIMLLTVYFDYLDSEKGRGFFFYRPTDGKKVKINKIKSTIYSAILMFPVVFALLLYFVEWRILVIGYLGALLVFCISANIGKLRIEKNDFKKIYTVKESLFIMVIAILSSWVINYKLLIWVI
ncbi:MAG: hypothetical protein ACOCNL_09260 [Acetivibrio ethanolgignens]